MRRNNHVTELIDEYAFDNNRKAEYFNASGELYYAGPMSYYRIEENQANFFANTGSISEYEDILQDVKDYREYSEQRLKNQNCPDGVSFQSDYDDYAMLNWNDLIAKNGDGYFVSDGKMLKGISNTTISGSNLSFVSTGDFSEDNNCGPVALTNLMIYLNYRDGKNTILNNSKTDTYNDLRVRCKHSEKNGTTQSNEYAAGLEYIYNCGYTDINLVGVNNDIEAYKWAIERDMPMISFLPKKGLFGSLHGHFVVTLGYQQLYNSSKDKYLNYIRIIDGWYTKHSGQYVDIQALKKINSKAYYFGNYQP